MLAATAASLRLCSCTIRKLNYGLAATLGSLTVCGLHHCWLQQLRIEFVCWFQHNYFSKATLHISVLAPTLLSTCSNNSESNSVLAPTKQFVGSNSSDSNSVLQHHEVNVTFVIVCESAPSFPIVSPQQDRKKIKLEHFCRNQGSLHHKHWENRRQTFKILPFVFADVKIFLLNIKW